MLTNKRPTATYIICWVTEDTNYWTTTEDRADTKSRKS